MMDHSGECMETDVTGDGLQFMKNAGHMTAGGGHTR